jgi:hypothetical protein
MPLELHNVRFPINDSNIKEELINLKKIPRMSTLTIAAIINYGVSQISPNEAFINVGVWNGFTLIAGMLNNQDKKCVGIDNFSKFGGPKHNFLERFNKYKSDNHLFFEMDYQDYFSTIHEGKIGFYLYDGDHSYKHQLNGLQKAEPYLSDNALILIDDTNWDEPRKATLDFISHSSNQYNIIFDCKTNDTMHPTYWNGIMILRRIV